MLLSASGICFASAEEPKATIDNGIVHATIYLPDSAKGFYRGTRFDWSGIVADLTFAGHTYYSPWFTKMDPGVRDFIFDGPEIVAGASSSAMGPVEEFITGDDSSLGFEKAVPGETFVKIGVGTLKKPDNQKYSSFRQYEMVDAGQWKVRVRATSVEFTQKLVDRRSGYGYVYIKKLRLLPGKSVLVIDHSLKNVGRLPIDTDVYNHNFLVLDHQATGPDFKISLPFPIKPERPIKDNLGAVEGRQIVYRKQLEGREVFTVHIGGLSGSPKDYDIQIENSRLGAGMRITGDHPLEKEELWSIRSTVALEPFVRLRAAPGETVHWSHSYLYYVLKNEK